MSTIWFTSDLHFGHPKVSEIRGFGADENATEKHDITVVENWCARVKPQDTVYVLGDLMGRDKETQYALGVINELPGTKHLIAGNHDPVSSIHRNGWKRQREFLQVFTSVRDFARIRHNGQQMLMSHYPYADSDGADHTSTPRYAEYRLPDCGVPLLHGHTHKADQRLHRSRKGTVQVHVGLDAWGLKPVRLQDIYELIHPPGQARTKGTTL